MIINGTSTNRIDPCFLNEQYIQKLRDDRARLNQIVGSAVFPKEDKQVLFNPNISTTTFQGSHNCTTKQARQNKGQKIGTETQRSLPRQFLQISSKKQQIKDNAYDFVQKEEKVIEKNKRELAKVPDHVKPMMIRLKNDHLTKSRNHQNNHLNISKI